MKLITELVESVSYITEAAEDGSKRHFIEGTFAQAETPNRNKRIYPLTTLQRECTRYLNENVKLNRGYGELGHPQGPTINLDRTCILIKELKQDGNDFKGKAMVTSRGMGEILRGLLEDGANVGVSTRALGSLKPLKEGLNEVQDDLRLLAIDVVADPSAPGAWVNGIMEGKEYIYDASEGTIIEQSIDRLRSKMKRMSVREIEEQKMQLFESFLSKLVKSKI